MSGLEGDGSSNPKHEPFALQNDNKIAAAFIFSLLKHCVLGVYCLSKSINENRYHWSALTFIYLFKILKCFKKCSSYKNDLNASLGVFKIYLKKLWHYVLSLFIILLIKQLLLGET